MRCRTKLVSRAALAALLCAALMIWAPQWPQSLAAQSTSYPPSQSQAPEWETAAGGKMAFDSAIVKRNTTTPPQVVYFNMPIGPGDISNPNNGGLFRAMNLPLSAYIAFAYKMTGNQEEVAFTQAPKWVRTDRYDIQGKVEGSRTKDQMRLMMQSLLADRFRLSVHYETRQMPVFVLMLDTPGRTGPQLQRHPDDVPCPDTTVVPSPAPTDKPQYVDSRFPASCGGVLPMPPSAPGRARSGARNITMDLLASSLLGDEGIDRPVLNRTGLPGTYDFAIEFAPQADGRPPSETNFRPDPTGPTFAQALQEQLGLKLEAQTGPVDVVIVDYVEAPALE